MERPSPGEVPYAEGASYTFRERMKLLIQKPTLLPFLCLVFLWMRPEALWIQLALWVFLAIGFASLFFVIRHAFARTSVGPIGICEHLWLKRRCCRWSEIRYVELSDRGAEGCQLVVYRADGREIFHSADPALHRTFEHLASLEDARKPAGAVTEAWPPRATGRTYPFRARAAVTFIAVFLFAVQGFLIVLSPALPETMPIVLVFDVWLALFTSHALLARTTVDESGVRVASPVWRRGCPFHRIVTVRFQPLPPGGSVLVVLSGRGVRIMKRFFSASPEVDEAFERIAEHFGAE